ncbi:MAG: acetoin utilization protein AcuC [Proteobacteria bacterium]|nr:acetoin utilization protein AcuC [Pseudomonadota bacterium]
MGGPRFVFSDDYHRFDYGPSHPLRVHRLGLWLDMARALGLIVDHDPACVEARSATREELARWHDPYYLDVLEKANSGLWSTGGLGYGLGTGDNPVFKGVFEWSALLCGASVQCLELVGSGQTQIAFNPAGGMHHGGPSKASGFCYLNDAALIIQMLLDQGRRVAYVDIDAHHGDGVQWAFYRTDRALTVSVHQSGRTLFPGTGSEKERGDGPGRGYCLNLPLLPDADDEIFRMVVDRVVLPVVDAYDPDLLVTQLGVDMMYSDPLANLNLTSHGFMHAVKGFKGLGRPWIALGGGGYNVINVARCWTLAWAAMADRDVEDRLPEEVIAHLPGRPPRSLTLHHADSDLHGGRWETARAAAVEVIDFHRQESFGLFGLSGE